MFFLELVNSIYGGIILLVYNFCSNVTGKRHCVAEASNAYILTVPTGNRVGKYQS